MKQIQARQEIDNYTITNLKLPLSEVTDIVKKDLLTGIANEMFKNNIIDITEEKIYNGNMKYSAECFVLSYEELAKIFQIFRELNWMNISFEMKKKLSELKNLLIPDKK